MEFQRFRDQVHRKFKLDLNSYKENQLKRRINNLMQRRGIDGYDAYLRQLSGSREAVREFIDYLMINVTEFFRDKKPFHYLEHTLLPEMVGAKPRLKIWSAACSNGAEPYSVTMILDDLTPGVRHQIEATDLDPGILRLAAKARYAPELVRNVSPVRLRKHFKKEGDQYALSPSVTGRVRFRRHDLLGDPYGSGYDLIICRNVQIYFTRAAQERMNARFCRALVPGGILFLGSSETIFNAAELGYKRLAPCFYRKVSEPTIGGS